MNETTNHNTSAQGICWDLGDLFSSEIDPKIQATLNDGRKRAEAFSERFKNKINVPGGPDPKKLLDAVGELEEIEEALSRVGTYSSLLYSGDSLKPEFQDLDQKIEQETTEIHNLLLFFQLEWMDLDENLATRLIDHPQLKTYSRYLKNLRRFRPHKLTEAEEKIVNAKDNTGRNAFGRLFSEITSALTFSVEGEGEITLSEILALFHHPDRDRRKKAMETLYEGLSHHRHVLAFIYDTLIQDHLTMDGLRYYPSPVMERHLSNEIDAEAVDQMLALTETHTPMAQDYFRLKAALLKLPKLALYDQYAPVGGELPAFSFAQAKDVILDAFGFFSPVFRDVAGQFFDHHWIDAEIRKGKRGGAFCASPSPKLHPYILCNYTDNLRDVMTVAHELGHGLHGYLSREQTFMNYDTPLTTAETASVFGEMLVFDYLVERQTDPHIKIALLAGKIEDAFATVFRQSVLTRFELLAFTKRKEKRLTSEDLGALWIEANGKYYGNAVEIPEGYRWGWSYIPHFIHSRFYCYSYVFGQLLVLALYRMYKEEGKGFVPKYLSLLQAGGSDSPEALLKPLGVDFHQAQFWQKGFDELRGLIGRLEELVRNEH